MACLDFAREQLKVATAGAIAAVIVEPDAGHGRQRDPAAGVPARRAGDRREHDALLIADEMITGFGRTGKMFGCEHTDTEPDVDDDRQRLRRAAFR